MLEDLSILVLHITHTTNIMLIIVKIMWKCYSGHINPLSSLVKFCSTTFNDNYYYVDCIIVDRGEYSIKVHDCSNGNIKDEITPKMFQLICNKFDV